METEGEFSEDAKRDARRADESDSVDGERNGESPTPRDLERTVAWLEHLLEDHELLATLSDELRVRLLSVCGRVARPTYHERKEFAKVRYDLRRKQRRRRDEALLDRTGIRQQRIELVFPTPDPSDNERDSSAFIEDVSGAVETKPEPSASADANADTTASSDEARPQLEEPRTCYICKADYREVHEFYDAMCLPCAAFNWQKRRQSVDLTGRVALLTGGRVKIGYQVGIKLLRAGARLIVTTRFPRDAAARYAAEPDFEEWQERLDVYGLDLRHTPSVEALVSHVADRYERLDFLINNACQTVRRPPGFYAHLMEGEALSYDALPVSTRRLLAEYEELCDRAEAGELRALRVSGAHEATGGDSAADAAIKVAESSEKAPTDDKLPDEKLSGIRLSAALSQAPLVPGDLDVGEQLFPTGRLDADLQQVDLRDVNSWRLPLADVPTVELLEVHLVNAVAPFVLNARLKGLMKRTPERDKHIVNVSAMEGQFYRAFKTDKHPHTNMAKAALNMMTRTSAPDYLADGIHMNSVDTGWITDEDPMHLTIAKREEHGFHPPLDHVDAAARILDPIFDGLATGRHHWGQFLKDYKPTRW